MTTTDDLLSASEARARGNELFRKERFIDAKREYAQGIRLLTATTAGAADAAARPADPEAVASELALLLTNRGLCNLKTLHVEDALADVARACSLAPQRAKGFAVKGEILVKMDRYSEAVAAFEHAMQLDRELPDIEAKLHAAQALVASYGACPYEHRIQRAESRLAAASMAGNVDAMRDALDQGAAVDCRVASVDNSNATPLVLATRAAKLDAVKFLLANGADANAVDAQGRSALWYAAEQDAEACAAALLAAGADKARPDNTGMSPYQAAEARFNLDGASEVICLFDDAGEEERAKKHAAAAAALAERQRALERSKIGYFYWLTTGVVAVSVVALIGMQFVKR